MRLPKGYTMKLKKKPIKERELDVDNMIFDLDMEKKKISIVGRLTTKYEADEDKDEIRRPHIILRGAEYEVALEKLFPNQDIIKNRLAEILVEYIK